MRKILLGHLKKIPLLLSLLLLCAGSIVGQSFECNSDLYQVVNGNELKRLNPSTGIYESVGTSSITYNGAGFNSEDNFIYAIGSGTTLVRIDNTGDATSLGNISNFSAISYSGDFDLEGNWYSFRKSGSSWLLNKIDVSVLPAVAERLTVQELSGPAPASNANDIAYNIVSNRFYGMDDGYIMEFDPVARTVRTLADYREITEDGGYGAVWSDETGNTYFFNNNTGNIYRAAINASGEITSFAFISTSSPNGNNDGMSCPTALPPAFPEICDNGIDDDNDGLVDCEDPDCSASASCGISSEIYSSSFACNQSIVTYHTFFTNHSNLTNTITVTEQLPQGFVFLQDTLEFDAGGNSDFTSQPQEGDEGTITWGNIHLNAGETVRISYDVTLKSEVQFGTVANSISVTPDRDEILITPTVLSSEITVGDCPEPASYSCEPAFYQVYKKKGKNQPNMYGRLNPITGDYDPIAVASDYANGLGYDVNSGIVFGASGNRFISLDKDGIVIDQGITFSKKVYRGDINNSSEWYGVVGNDMLKIDVSGPPTVMATYANQGLQGWDIAYNTDGNFYSLHNSTLYQFNTSTNTKITIGQLAGVNLPQSGGYGAQWTGSDGYLYASHNQSGRILRINVEDATARVVSQSIDGLSKNDGFSCPTSIPVVFEYDYGDNSRLPQSRILSYRQDLGQDGLPDFSTFWLGNTVNYDLDDPSNASSDGDLDDGVTFTNQIDNGTISAIIGLNTNISGTAYYLIGLDWNDDGIFDEILNNHQVMEGANTIVEIINAPTSYTGGFLNARVIVSEELLTQDQISGDILGLGEIEDYRLEIFEPCYGEECEVTTGTNGGLESNGDLSEAIAKRNYGRLKNNYKKHIKSHQKELKEFKISRSGRANGISNYFPEFGVSGKEEVTVSSPEDLIGITNAKEVFAVDYYLNNQRVAASLLLSTENEVYNHSKNVCDRLNGKSINDVRIIHVSGMSIILANIKHETGNMEYSAWFSAREANDQYEVFSQWNVDSYPEGKYLNFQVWSSSPAQVFYLLEHIIAELKKSRKVITNSKHQQLPDVLVKSGQYQAGSLVLTLQNRKKVSNATFDINLRRTENGNEINQKYKVDLSGAEEQEIVIETGFLFDAGISLRSENSQSYDALYLADGAWGVDYNSDLSEIAEFTVLAQNDVIPGVGYMIERGFEVNGISTDVVNVFRNLKAGNETVVLDSYSTMSMSIMNNYPVEVSLVPTNLENWDQRLKLSLPAHSERSEIILKLEDFEGIDRLPTLDIQTVVFSYLNMSGTPENFQFTAGNIAFGNQIVLSTDVLSNQLMGLKLYPNPVRNRLYLKVKDTGGLFKITNMNGQNMLTKTIDTMDLENGIPISLKNGLYIVVYEGRDGNHQQLLQVE